MIANIASKPAAAPNFRVGDERLVKLTPSAAQKVSSLLTKQGRPNGVLRVAVVGGGCSGLQYKMDLQDAPGQPRHPGRIRRRARGGGPQERALRDRQRTGLSRRAGWRVQGEKSQRRDDLFLRRKLQRVNVYSDQHSDIQIFSWGTGELRCELKTRILDND